METNDNQQKDTRMYITKNAEKNLRITAVWTKFYAILSFIGVGFVFLIGLGLILAGNLEPNELADLSTYNFMFAFPKALGIIYMLLSIVMLFPAIFLLQYSIYTKRCLSNSNVATLEVAFNKMKSYWLYMGIVTIASIVLAAIVPVIAIFGTLL